MEIVQNLLKEYDYNQPILLNELKIPGIRKDNLKQSFSRLAKRGLIERFDRGVYYIPSITPLGKSRLATKKVYEKKYITDGQDTYGFYAGLAFQNAIGLTTQVPNVIEIVTNRESSRSRDVMIGNQKIRLRKPNFPVTNENVKILQFLDLMNKTNLSAFSKPSKEFLIRYVKLEKFNRNDISAYISYYPSRTAKNLINSGVIYDLT